MRRLCVHLAHSLGLRNADGRGNLHFLARSSTATAANQHVRCANEALTQGTRRLLGCVYQCADNKRAIDIVQRAIDEDVKHNYQEAYVQYQNSLDYFMMAMKCTCVR